MPATVGARLSDTELGGVDTRWGGAGSVADKPDRRPLPERVVLAAREALEAAIGATFGGTTAAHDAAPYTAPPAGALAGEDDLGPTHRWLTDNHRVD